MKHETDVHRDNDDDGEGARRAVAAVLDRTGATEVVSDALHRWVDRPTRSVPVSTTPGTPGRVVLGGEVGFLDLRHGRWTRLCRWSADVDETVLTPWALAAVLTCGTPIGRLVTRLGMDLHREAPPVPEATESTWLVRTTITRDGAGVAVVDEHLDTHGVEALVSATHHQPPVSDGQRIAELDVLDRDLVAMSVRRRALATQIGTPLARWARHDELLTHALRGAHPNAVANDLVSGLTRPHLWGTR